MEADTKESSLKTKAVKKVHGKKSGKDVRSGITKQSEKDARSETAKQFGVALTNLRNEYKLTQTEFSEMIGLSQAQFSALEAGKYSLSYSTMDRISEALGIDPIVLAMRLFAEGLVLRGAASGLLDTKDFKEIGDDFVTKVKERCQHKFQSTITSDTSLSAVKKTRSVKKRTTRLSKQLSE